MESAIFGLVGVALGALLTVAREWWFQKRKNRKDAEFLAVVVSCELDRYVACCAEVVGDDGLYRGQSNKMGYSETQVKIPKFDPLTLGVDWKSLPVDLMHEILNFPYMAEVASNIVSYVYDYDTMPPDFAEFFEERQYQYAILGITASKLVKKLRNYAGLSARSFSEWNAVEYMEKTKTAIDLLRKKRADLYHIPNL